MSRHVLILTCLIAVAAGCENAAAPPATNSTPTAAAAESPTDGSIVLLSVTGDGSEDAQPLDMAMKLAGFSLDEGRQVVMFFNVKGVRVPTASFSSDVAFQDTPVKEQLAALIERGADVHVCPICMKALGVEASDLVEGAQVTTRSKLFATIGNRTAVFTY